MIEPERNRSMRAVRRLRFFLTFNERLRAVALQPSDTKTYAEAHEVAHWMGAALCDERVISEDEWERLKRRLLEVRYGIMSAVWTD